MTIYTVQIIDKLNPKRTPDQISFKTEKAFSMFQDILKRNLLPNDYEVKTFETIA
jgi:hypothetical protein